MQNSKPSHSWLKYWLLTKCKYPVEENLIPSCLCRWLTRVRIRYLVMQYYNCTRVHADIAQKKVCRAYCTDIFTPATERTLCWFEQFWSLRLYYYNNCMLKSTLLSSSWGTNGLPRHIAHHKGSWMGEGGNLLNVRGNPRRQSTIVKNWKEKLKFCNFC